MKCKDCQHRVIDWMTAYDGRGIIEFSYCGRNMATCKMVDPDVERECDSFPEKTEALPEVQNAA